MSSNQANQGRIRFATDENGNIIHLIKSIDPELRGVYESLMGVHNENLAAILAVTEEDGKVLVHQEYIRGENLRNWRGTVTDDVLLRIAIDVTKALCVAHALQPPIIHRDVKPSNILRRPDGSCVLVDFDAGRPLKSDADGDTQVVGTIGFCVVVKDLSHLGRNYAKMGYYTEEYFTDRGVRFIAINDSVDNMRDEENDLAPFKNVLNEWYPRDVSKKIRQVRRKHAQMGYFTGGTPAYGYRKDPDDPHKLIVDERGAAAVVQRIFKQFIACMSAQMIAEMLNKEGIDCPRFYHAKYNRGQPPRPKEINAWSSTTILTLLINEVYIGNMVQGKRRVISYKNKNRRQVPKEDWISVKGTHEPIIDKETWERVQELKRARRSTGHVLKYKGRDSVGMFTGVLTCADCGSHLVSNYKTNKNGHSYCYYRCSRYNYNGVHTCSQHKIMEDTLIEVVLCDIRKYANLSADEKSTLAQELGKRARTQRMEDAAQCKREQRECEHRLEIIAKNTTKLYDDRCAGLPPDTVFGGLLAGYTREQEELNKRSKELSQKYAGLIETENDVARWVDLIGQYVNLEKLDRSIVLNLIDEIVVSEEKMVDGERVQDIRIRYRFVGRMLEEADAAS